MKHADPSNPSTRLIFDLISSLLLLSFSLFLTRISSLSPLSQPLLEDNLHNRNQSRSSNKGFLFIDFKITKNRFQNHEEDGGNGCKQGRQDGGRNFTAVSEEDRGDGCKQKMFLRMWFLL